MRPDLSADGPMLLGTVGWQRRDWVLNYYPDDLPPEWRLAYLGNDCDCVLLPAREWYAGAGGMSEALDQALDEAPDGLTFLLETQPGEDPTPSALARFEGYPVVLLGGDAPGVPGDWVACRPDGRGAWVAVGGARILIWSVEAFDMRTLRERVRELPTVTRVLLLDGPAASPARIPDLRTLTQLLGMA